MTDDKTWPAEHVDQWSGPNWAPFCTIRCIAINPETGDVYVTDDSRIQRFTADGVYVSTAYPKAQP